jgi:hypothetical protein
VLVVGGAVVVVVVVVVVVGSVVVVVVSDGASVVVGAGDSVTVSVEPPGAGATDADSSFDVEVVAVVLEDVEPVVLDESLVKEMIA